MTAEDTTATASAAATDSENAAETLGKGHGRNGADTYRGAEKIEVRHESLQPGDPCPQCEEGTVYETNRAGVLVRPLGQAPVGAKVYYLQKLRCNLCGVLFTARPPEGAGEKKHDATVGSMIAMRVSCPPTPSAGCRGTAGKPWKEWHMSAGVAVH